MKKIITFCFLFALLAACTTSHNLYEWGDYSKSLLVYSKNPEQRQRFADSLIATISKSEKSNKVPPGLYAEYGYLLIELERPQDAVIYFGKEKNRWPESAALMDKIILKLTSPYKSHLNSDTIPFQDASSVKTEN
jgi:hypothetical protein